MHRHRGDARRLIVVHFGEAATVPLADVDPEIGTLDGWQVLWSNRPRRGTSPELASDNGQPAIRFSGPSAIVLASPASATRSIDQVPTESPQHCNRSDSDPGSSPSGYRPT